MFDANDEQKIDSGQKPDKLGFLAEQTLIALRESYVTNPQDVAYQFSRRVADEIIKSRYQTDNMFVKEGLAITVYKGIENLMLRLLRK